jgi:hypothetical protein
MGTKKKAAAAKTTSTKRSSTLAPTDDEARAAATKKQRGDELKAAAGQSTEANRARILENKRVSELAELLDPNHARLDDTLAAIASRRSEEKKDRGAYYPPGTFIVVGGRPCHPTETIEVDGKDVPAPATPLIPAKATDEDLDALEAEHNEELQAELDALTEKLGL